MKKLLSLVLVLAFASLASALTMDLVGNADNTSFSIALLTPGLFEPPGVGMSGAVDGSGVYFAITGVNTDSGSLAATLPAVLILSSANEGDAGDTGLFDYGLGTYGEFRAGPPRLYVAAAGIYSEGYTPAAGAKAVSLYRLNYFLTAATLIETITIPEPATIVLLCLGGLVLRKRRS